MWRVRWWPMKPLTPRIRTLSMGRSVGWSDQWSTGTQGAPKRRSKPARRSRRQRLARPALRACAVGAQATRARRPRSPGAGRRRVPAAAVRRSAVLSMTGCARRAMSVEGAGVGRRERAHQVVDLRGAGRAQSMRPSSGLAAAEVAALREVLRPLDGGAGEHQRQAARQHVSAATTTLPNTSSAVSS